MKNIKNDTVLKLNIGCAGRPLAGYINIDLDTLDELKKRYPGSTFPEGVEVFQYDIFDLPYSGGTVDEICADSFLEHLSFGEERRFFTEVERVLRPGGHFLFSVPDFEETCRQWLEAEDDWRDFYRNDEEAIRSQHWFGQYSYSTKSRWGYLTASIFGPQNSPGQFHKNCYTEGKIRAMLAKLGFSIDELTRSLWKGDRNLMINVVSSKK